MKIYIKILLAPILCVLSVFIFKLDLDFFPLVFSIVISVINFKKFKTNPFLGSIYSLLLSFSIYVASLSVSLLSIKCFETIFGESVSGLIGTILGTFILAPLLVYEAYRFLFTYTRTKKTIFIISISILVLITLFVLTFYSIIKTNYKIFDYNTIDIYCIWQIVVALALQLIIYQKEIFKSKIREK